MTPQAGGSVTRITGVRVAWQHDVKTVRLTALSHDGLTTEEIRLHGHVIGFIHCAGLVFVALAGTRLDQAVECDQSLVWDEAAARLIIESGLFPEEQAPPFRSAWPVRVTGARTGPTNPSLARTPSRVRQKSR